MEPSSKFHRQFHSAYLDYSDQLFGFCASKVKQREEALDIIHDVFVNYWQVLLSGVNITNTKAYLYKIARNKIIDHYRSISVKRVFNLENEIFDHISDNSFNLYQTIDMKIVLEAINKLEELYREPLLYRYIDGLAVQDIALLLDTTPGAITKRLRRGIDNLRDTFNQ